MKKAIYKTAPVNFKVIGAVLTAAILLMPLAGCRPKNSQTNAGIDAGRNGIDAAHNSRNSVNWEGVYTGTIPAADGPGINVRITLNTDETYEMTSDYIDRDGVFTESGKFSWDESGGIIILDVDPQKQPSKYRVGENTLMQLDLEGNEITGMFADNYILHKSMLP
ncbi:MAG: copper resistance protein NlpE N-terminal domain-containing protein [Spirochaetaceae bacterium]|jgi:uncharacterized lipoprotein NlpE involved in copper resistance|nr:copper resistance protein NlpE N-terminal domain-containing protein [Spirochaetaceae bacterium]